MSSSKKNIASKLGKILIPILVMILIIYQAKSIFSEIDLKQVVNIMKGISPHYLTIFLIIAVVAIICLCSYDLVLMDYYDYKVRITTTLRISWIAVSFNNIMGFGGLTGASLRTYLFNKEGIKTKDMINYNMILVPSSIIGLSLLAFLSIFNIFDTYALLDVYKWLWLAILAFCFFIPIYFFLGKFQWLNDKLKRFNLYFEGSVSVKLKLTIFSVLDWLSRGLLMYAIARCFNGNVTYLSILGVDIIGSVAGLISFIPSGVGSYDIIALMALQNLGFTANTGLSIILLFRIYYFIIPWIIGGILWIITLIKNGITTKSNRA